MGPDRRETVTESETLTTLNNPEAFILAIVDLDNLAARAPRCLRCPFQREPGFDVTSVNYALAELLARAEDPA